METTKQPSFNYVFDPDITSRDALAFWQGFILGKTQDLLRQAGIDMSDLVRTLPAEQRKSVVFMTSGSSQQSTFVMKFGDGYKDHEMDPNTLTVSGEIFPAQGILPVLILIRLKQILSKQGYGNMAKHLQFCDEQGKLFEYHKWDDMQAVCKMFSVSLDYAKEIARKIELIGKSLAELIGESNHEQFYF